MKKFLSLATATSLILSIPSISLAATAVNPLKERIVYTEYPTTGDSDIFLMNPDGTNSFKLQENFYDETEAELSPDGTKVLFNTGSGIAIRDVNATSTYTNSLNASSAAHDPHWTPDGKAVVYVDANNGDIWKVNVDGTGLVNLTNTPYNSEMNIDVSPTGEIVFCRDGVQLFTMDLNGEHVRQLTDTTNEYYHSARWSPDGQSIAYITAPYVGEGQQSIRQLKILNVKKKKTTTLLEKNEMKHVAWSPDGTKLAVNIKDVNDTVFEIYTLSKDGSNLTKVTNASVTGSQGAELSDWGYSIK